MNTNPYTTPTADLTVAESSEKPKKPVALTILQIFVWPVAAGLLYLAVADTLRYPSPRVLVLWAMFAWEAAILFAAHKRKPIVRLLGGLWIALFIVGGLLTLAKPDPNTIGNTPYALGRMLGAAVTIGLEIYWLYALAFAPKAKRYLSSR